MPYRSFSPASGGVYEQTSYYKSRRVKRLSKLCGERFFLQVFDSFILQTNGFVPLSPSIQRQLETTRRGMCGRGGISEQRVWVWKAAVESQETGRVEERAKAASQPSSGKRCAGGDRTLFVRICRREGPSECAQLPSPNANARAQHWQDAGKKFPLSDLNCSRF